MPRNTVPLTESYASAVDELPFINTTVAQFFRDAASLVPDRLALVAPVTKTNAVERRWTYSQLLAESERAAAALLQRFKPGDHVTLMAASQAEFVILQLGAAFAGVVLVTLNPASSREELIYSLVQSESVGLVANRTYGGTDCAAMIEGLKSEAPTLATVIYLDDWRDFIASARLGAKLPHVAPEDPALIIFTSGTTGKPKGMVHLHRGIVGMGRATAARRKLAEGSVWLPSIPMYHLGGSVLLTLACFANLGTQIVVSEFSPELLLPLIERYRINFAALMTNVLHAMVEHESFAKHDLSSLQFIYTLSRGGPVARETIDMLRDKLRVDVGRLYGLSEAGGAVTQSYRGESMEHLCDTLGRVIAGCEMKVAHPETGKPVPIGKMGEFCVRGPYTMKEYFRMPEMTAQTIDADGWLHTGDAGFMRDDGYVIIAGRTKDIIVLGDESLFPREVEDALTGHPDLAQVAVFGVPNGGSGGSGEQVAAALCLKPGAQAKDEDFAAYLDGKIAPHKIPRVWMRVDTFPTNVTGKIQKFVLREMWVAQAGNS